MQTAPTKAVKKAPGGMRPAGEQRRIRRRPRPRTIVFASLVTLGVLSVMSITLLGIWPPKIVEPAPEATIKATSQYAKGLKIESNGPVKKDPQTGQLTIPLKATNNVIMPPRPQGTPQAGATPQPGPAKVLAATVKVLCFTTGPDGKRRQSGTAYGGFNLPQGLAPGQTQAFEVQASGVAACDDHEAFADILSTDQDPIKTEQTGNGQPTSPVESPTSIPLATASIVGTTP